MAQLPVSPTPQQPQSMGAGAAEQQQQLILQQLIQRAADPAARMQMAQQLAQAYPAPPTNIFSGQGLPRANAQAPQQQPQQPIDIQQLGALIPPQQQAPQGFTGQTVHSGFASSPSFAGPPSPFVAGNPGFIGPVQP